MTSTVSKTANTNTNSNSNANDVEELALPHERDETASTAVATEPDPVIQQAKRDLDAGLVDTDMYAAAGLDAARRKKMVPGPGGVPPAERAGT